MAVSTIGRLGAAQTRPDTSQPLGPSRVIFRPQPNTPFPAGLDHGRALGTGLNVRGPITVVGLVHQRQIGFSSYIPPFNRGQRLTYTQDPDYPSRVIFFLPATYSAPGGLDHNRVLGVPFVAPKPAPAALVHSRAIGDPPVTVRTAANPAPPALIHARGSSTPAVTTNFVPPIPPQLLPAPNLWPRTLRATRRRQIRYR